MKRIYTILIAAILTIASTAAYAIPAKQGPITVIQPDGTSVVVEIHGDEFLNWKTINGKLVERGIDGYFYYASFDMNGGIVMSKSRVSNFSGLTKSSGSSVIIPQVAKDRANAKRNLMTAMRADKPNKAITEGSHKFLTILIDFPDLKMIHDKDDFTRLLNEKGYSENGGTGSAKDFYTDNSSGKFDPEFVVIGPYTASKNFSYYGQNDSYTGQDMHMTELFAEIVRKADQDIDFSQYDVDNNGVVDNLFFYYAGHNEAEGGPSESIWPHQYSLYYENVSVDGKKVLDYACTSELRGDSGNTLCGIGTFCHEFGHVLGLPDFYDTDYNENGSGKALGEFSLMSSGSYNNDGNTPPFFTSIERELMNWSEEATEINADGDYTLETVDKNKAYKVLTENDGEYFQFESRGGESWDKYIPTGMLIYHVDKSSNKVGYKTAKSLWNSGIGINDYKDHQCCDLVEACGKENLRGDSDADIFPGTKNVTSFTASTKPAFRDWAGRSIPYRITKITDNGKAGVTFNVASNDIESEYKFVIDKKMNAIYIPAGSIKYGSQLGFEMVYGGDKGDSITWYYDDEEVDPTKSVVLQKGTHTIKAKITYSDRTETITQTINVTE